MMMPYPELHDRLPSNPGSPPSMTTSKSSKTSSSFHSRNSDDNTVLADVGHFEDIGLDDDAARYGSHHAHAASLKPAPSPYAPQPHPDAKGAPRPQGSPQPQTASRELARPIMQRRFATTHATGAAPSLPSLKTNIRASSFRSVNTNLLAEPHVRPSPASPSGGAGQPPHRRRSPSPAMSLNPRDPNLMMKPRRRSSWQSTRERKTALELELECDEDDDEDDIPDGVILDNVPISPRLPSERAYSQPPSKSPSPTRDPKERVRSVGHGTPPVAMAQGSLRSPSWKSETALSALKSAGSSEAASPTKSRAKSWTAALAGLSDEAKAITEKLEQHADELEQMGQQPATSSAPSSSRSFDQTRYRVRSAHAELPPLRRTNIMIDPLPVSKEKEAVLSRTRPSWLPPKDPAEERRHLKEYQKMMAQSAEADRRRENSRKARTDFRDMAADSLMHIWEEQILPRWNDAIRERRTRELWWKGIAPRSRGAVWGKAIGNGLGLSRESFQAALHRAQDAKARIAMNQLTADDERYASWFNNISLDIDQHTWPDLRIFQAGGPLHQNIVDILSAYAMYRCDVGYVPGCSTVAALLLLNLPSAPDAFIALANVLHRPLPHSFVTSDPGAKASAYNLIMQTLAQKSDGLHKHLTRLPDSDPDIYLGTAMTTLFTKHLALDEVTRLWDVFVFEGDVVLVRASVALLLENEMAILGAKDIDEVCACLDKVRGGSAQQIIGNRGAEDSWMKSLREAGKS